MNSSASPASSNEHPSQNAVRDSNLASEDESTGVPGFRTWAGVYWFVFGSFVLWVVLLALLTNAVS